MFPQSKQILVLLAFLLHTSLVFSQGHTDCPSPTFFKTFGFAGQAEYGTAIIRSADNHLFLAGRDGNRTFIQKLKPSGEVVWTRDFQVSVFEAVTPSEIIFDSEGMIVGCGTQGQAGLSKCFVFRYDPQNNAVLWAHQISSNNPTVGGILEKGPGGNFIVYQTSLLANGEKDAEIIEIDRATGLLNPSLSKRYEHISSDGLSKMIYVNGALYATGASTCRHGNFNAVRTRQLLARFDPGTFDPIWAHLNHLDTLAPISFIGRDLLADSNALITAYVGSDDINIGGVGDDTIYLQKTDLEGNIQWVRSYNILAGVLKLIAVSDGYVIYGQQNGHQHLVFKTDKNGLPLWGRILTEATPGFVFPNNFAPNQAVAINDSLYFTGISTHGDSDVFFWKMYGNGTMADTCSTVDTLDVQSSLVANPFRTLVDLSQVFSTAASTSVSPTLQNIELELQQFCPDCSVPDLCPEDNDFVVEINDIYCEQGFVNMQFSFCDLQGGAVAPLTISFFDANPYLQVAGLLGTYDYSPVTTDSCWSVELTNLVTKFGASHIQNGLPIYAVVNVPGNAETPFNLNEFPLTDFAECDYTNNMDVFTIDLPTAPTLNLGLDQSVCPNQGAMLNAGAGFFKYQWSNGQTTPAITVNFSGQFRVTVTDFCGFKQTDTVEVQVLNTPLLTENGSFCPGNSVTVHGFLFAQPGVFQRTILGANSDCDTVATFFITELPYLTRNEIVRFCPGETVTINGVTYDESGLAKDTLTSTITCDTIVFYFLQQLPLPFRLDTAYICPGDSVLVGDYYYSEPGIATDTLPNLGPIGCDTLLRVRIILLPQVTIDETIQFCPGTSVTIQGQEYAQPGILAFTLPSTTGGCDTLLQYTLEWLPAPTRSETLAFCQGSSVNIGGNTYTMPGTVQLTIPGGGTECDTLVTYTLVWLPSPTRSETIQFCPGSSISIAGNQYTLPGTVIAMVSGQAGACDTLVTYTLEWLPGPTRSETIEFCPGTSVTIGGNQYSQPGTVLNTIPGSGGGCDTVVTYTLSFSNLPTSSETVEFCIGSSVIIGGQTYSQPATVVQTVQGVGGACDTVVTYTLQYVDPLPSTLNATCPFSINVITTPGTGQTIVNYNQPTATSDCLCPGINWTLTNGFASGSFFPPGTTQVCYTAKDSCGSSDNCCFDVIVREEGACDTKMNGCLKYDILGITADAQQRYTYRIRVTNFCANKLSYTAIQLPNGIVAASPSTNSVYESPEGRDYLVRNPNYAPFYSIRFKTMTDSIANGQSSVLLYTLPPQSHPSYIRIISRLEPQVFYEATLNTFNCPIGVTKSGDRDDPEAAHLTPATKNLLLYPNPTSGSFFADLSDWQGEQMEIRILDSRGQLVQSETLLAGNDVQAFQLPKALSNGLYFLEIMPESGEKVVGRFVLEW